MEKIKEFLDDILIDKIKIDNNSMILRLIVSLIVYIIIPIIITSMVIPIFLMSAISDLSDLIKHFKKKYYKYTNIKKIINSYYIVHHKNIKSYYLQNSIDSRKIEKLNVSTKELSKFIYWFLYNGKDNYYTMHNGNIVCEKNKRRSAGDIYLICKHYYPDCTFNDVMKILLTLVLNDVNITCSYCCTINKLVYFIDSRDANLNSKTEYENNIELIDLIKIYK